MTTPSTQSVRSTKDGRDAVVTALAAFLAESEGRKPWALAADLAGRAGAKGAEDPQFQADVQALFDAGTIRLMSGGIAGGASFFRAMLVPAEPETPKRY
jgi:hypothetical protein